MPARGAPHSRAGKRQAIGRGLNTPPQTAAGEALDVTRSWWRQGSSSDADEKRVKRVVCNAKLVLREKASLESKRLGETARGSEVLVIDDEIVVDEAAGCMVVRCKIAQDSTPRGVLVHTLGWVTAAKEGELKLSPVLDRHVRGSSRAAMEQADGESGHSATDQSSESTSDSGRKPHRALPWSLKLGAQLENARDDPSFSRLSQPLSPPSGGADSMASRIAKRRQDLARERQEKRMTPRKVDEQEGGSQSGTPPGTRPGASSQGEVDPGPKFEWLSSSELTAIAAEKRKVAVEKEQTARAKHDTVEAQLGRLLHDKKIKLDELMKAWDRNHDV